MLISNGMWVIEMKLINGKDFERVILDDKVNLNIHKDNRSRMIHNGEYMHILKRLKEQPTAFDIDMVLEQLEDYGKYKGFLRAEEDKCENYISVSAAKQIVKGRGLNGILGYLDENIK